MRLRSQDKIPYRPVYIGHIVDKVFYLGSVIAWETVSCRVRYVDNGRSGIDDSLNHSCEEFVVGTAGVFCVEFHIIHESACIFYRADSPLQDFFPAGVELVVYVVVGCAYAGMYPLEPGIVKSIDCKVDVLFQGSGQGADAGFGDELRNLDDGLEVSRTGGWKSALDHIDLHRLKHFGELDLLYGVQLASGHLFSVSESGVEDVEFLLFHGEVRFSSYATFSLGSAGCLKHIMKATATTREYPANMYHGVLQSGVAALYT